MGLKTKTVSVEDLEVGMITAEDVIIEDSVLVGRTITLNEHIINKLQAFYPYNTIVVYVNEASNEKDLIELKKVEEEFKSISSDVKEIFGNNNTLTVDNTSEIRAYSRKLQDIIKTNHSILKSILLHGSKEDSIYRHSVNVAALSSLLGKWAGLNEVDCRALITASMLHDFGKTKISASILNKKTPLTKAEYMIIKNIPKISYEEVKKIPYIGENILLGVLMPHERCDGSGYPLGLKGDAIHPFGKILAIADVFDAINSNRIYRNKKKPFEALNLIKEESIQGKLDYTLCETFLKGLSNFYIGQDVLLSNGKQARIVQMDTSNISSPLLLVDEDFIDLRTNTDINIVQLI